MCYIHLPSCLFKYGCREVFVFLNIFISKCTWKDQSTTFVEKTYFFLHKVRNKISRWYIARNSIQKHPLLIFLWSIFYQSGQQIDWFSVGPYSTPPEFKYRISNPKLKRHNYQKMFKVQTTQLKRRAIDIWGTT